MHLIRKQKLLFATADEVKIDPNANEGFLNSQKTKMPPKNKIVGSMVSLVVCSLEPPYRNDMIIMTNINDAH